MFFENLNEKIKQDLDIYEIEINDEKFVLEEIIVLIKIINRFFLIETIKAAN